MGKGNYCIEL